jgi:hypothetical protein
MITSIDDPGGKESALSKQRQPLTSSLDSGCSIRNCGGSHQGQQEQCVSHPCAADAHVELRQRYVALQRSA